MPNSLAPVSLAEIARLVSGELRGDGQQLIRGASILAECSGGQITLVDSAEKHHQLEQSAATAAIVPLDFPAIESPVVAVADVHKAFSAVVMYFRPRRLRPDIGHSTGAWISPTAQVDPSAQVHPGATIGDDVTVGPGTIIHSGVRIMAGCRIGADSVLFPNVVLYEDSEVGDRVIVHAGAVIGAYGFGYREVQGTHQLAAQLGYVVLEDDVEVGACATIDRGTYGATRIGAGTKIDNLVQIAHNCRLGKHNLICGQVGIAGSTTTGDYVTMAGQVGVRDHVHIGDRAILCSKAGVPNSVAAGEIMLGQPATPLNRQRVQMAAVAKLPEMRRDFRKLQQQVESLARQFEGATPDSNDKAA